VNHAALAIAWLLGVVTGVAGLAAYLLRFVAPGYRRSLLLLEQQLERIEANARVSRDSLHRQNEELRRQLDRLDHDHDAPT
jgi:hypothetical protein